jgi:polysaccharide biosynthesis transport protein
VLISLVELIMRPIRDPATLTQLFGEAPLGVIPTVSARDRSARRGWFGRRKAQV